MSIEKKQKQALKILSARVQREIIEEIESIARKEGRTRSWVCQNLLKIGLRLRKG